MNRTLQQLIYVMSFSVSVFSLTALAEESGLLDRKEVDALTFDSERVEEDDFDTNVNPVNESALQGFDCMDKDGDSYLSLEELGYRDDCVENAAERGMATDVRTALILTRMDADRDRQISRREFNIWNEMQRQRGID